MSPDRDQLFWCAIAYIVGVIVGDLPAAEQSAVGYTIAFLLIVGAVINKFKQ